MLPKINRPESFPQRTIEFREITLKLPLSTNTLILSKSISTPSPDTFRTSGYITSNPDRRPDDWDKSLFILCYSSKCVRTVDFGKHLGCFKCIPEEYWSNDLLQALSFFFLFSLSPLLKFRLMLIILWMVQSKSEGIYYMGSKGSWLYFTRTTLKLLF